jgi:hypothetical protein
MDKLLSNDGIWIVGIMAITVGVPVIAYYWFQYRKAELEATLKHAMIERGMSAEDIKMVLEATAGEKSVEGAEVGNGQRKASPENAGPGWGCHPGKGDG